MNTFLVIITSITAVLFVLYVAIKYTIAYAVISRMQQSYMSSEYELDLSGPSETLPTPDFTGVIITGEDGFPIDYEAKVIEVSPGVYHFNYHQTNEK